MIQKTKISELPLADTLVGLSTIGVDAENKSVQVELDFLVDAANEAERAATAADKSAGKAAAAAAAADSAAENASVQALAAESAAETANKKAILAAESAAAAGRAANDAITAITAADEATQAAATAAQSAESAVEAATIAATNADTATQSASNATTAALDAATHPTYVGDDYFVYRWNAQTQAYDKTDIYVKGDGFEYADFTPEQLAALRGEKGDKGEKGEKGEGLDYNTMTPEEIAGIKGMPGDKGEKGDAFEYADFTPEQLAALRGEKGDTGDAGEVPDISNLQTVGDESLQTTDKTVVGAINELSATIGDADISEIGDGTVTMGIVDLATALVILYEAFMEMAIIIDETLVKINEVRIIGEDAWMSTPEGNIFGDKYLPCDGSVIDPVDYPLAKLPAKLDKWTLNTSSSDLITFVSCKDLVFSTKLSNAAIKIYADKLNPEEFVNSSCDGIENVIYADGIYLTWKSSGEIVKFSAHVNGTQWISKSMPAHTIKSVCFGNGKFVMSIGTKVNADADVVYQHMESLNGLDWTKVQSQPPLLSCKIDFVNNKWFISFSSDIYSSTDYVTWTKGSFIPPTAQPIVYFKGRYIVSCPCFGLFTSPDGITWTKAIAYSLVNNTNINTFIGDKLYCTDNVCIASQARNNIEIYYVTKDGINWEQKTLSVDKYANCRMIKMFNNDKMFIVNAYYEDVILNKNVYVTLQSFDGITWMELGVKENIDIYSLVFNGNAIYIAGYVKAPDSSNRAFECINKSIGLELPTITGGYIKLLE